MCLVYINFFFVIAAFVNSKILIFCIMCGDCPSEFPTLAKSHSFHLDPSSIFPVSHRYRFPHFFKASDFFFFNYISFIFKYKEHKSKMALLNRCVYAKSKYN